ncbi:MAG: glycosyltransferase family 2 protein [Desulfuromonadaceae bacterium]|nr:glycosyltransferase family 2 protein [Desulfuromonadaceae bacterium]
MAMTVAAIIPTHKRPELLKRAIASVLKQSVPVDEIIVVDDAACDVTRDLVHSFQQDQLRYCRQNTAGASASRNYGVQVARCEFVAFLDDDDEWRADKIAQQLQLVEAQSLDVCFSKIEIVYEGTNIHYLTNARLPQNLRQAICIENFIGGTISAMIRRTVFLSVGGFDLNFRAREEYDLWIRLVQVGARVGIVAQPLSIAYRSLNRRLRISSDIKKYEEAIALLNSKHRVLIEQTLSPELRTLRYRKQCQFLAAQAVTVGLKTDGSKYYMKSLRSRFELKVALMLGVCLLHPVLLIRLRALCSR